MLEFALELQNGAAIQVVLRGVRSEDCNVLRLDLWMSNELATSVHCEHDVVLVEVREPSIGVGIAVVKADKNISDPHIIFLHDVERHVGKGAIVYRRMIDQVICCKSTPR